MNASVWLIKTTCDGRASNKFPFFTIVAPIFCLFQEGNSFIFLPTLCDSTDVLSVAMNKSTNRLIMLKYLFDKL